MDKTRIILIVLTSIAVGLLCLSFAIPPMGIIDNSVLGAVGEVFGFSALWVGFDALRRGAKTTIEHGNTTVTIADSDNDDEKQL